MSLEQLFAISAAQGQNTEYAYLTSEQILTFRFTEQYNASVPKRGGAIKPCWYISTLHILLL